MDAQLKKGILNMCILHTLKEKEMYGYEIMKIVKSHFTDVYEGTIYSVLRRLASDELLESYVSSEDSGGPQRKYYRITHNGSVYFDNLANDWRELYKTVKNLGIALE